MNFTIYSYIDILYISLVVFIWFLIFAGTVLFFKIKYAFKYISVRDVFSLLVKRRYFRKTSNYHMPLLQDSIERFLFRLEEEYQLRLSPAAKSILIEPLIEFYSSYPENVEYLGEWRSSLDLIMQTINQEPAEEDSERQRVDGYRLITAMSVTQAFKITWCKIPPFCRRPNR